MTTKKLLLLLMPIFLSACANKSRPQVKQPDMFATSIKSDNKKVFNFSISAGQGADESKPERREAGGPPPKHGSENKNQAKGDMANESPLDVLFTHLETKLRDTGYCREGYVEIDNYESSGRLHIIGACNEVATPDDKRQFANNYGY
ncbi:hypothetical protein FX988_02722 [Paraglaciecola mesophila]|uniref:Lipoprotein n=1 Tax=Paraglaciecola mesophila TaxID=197222 RepID=A0A857JK86_9ALTE|nr:hypothetical protein [Paraglaciecola mesophila]QHJ12465.1 hypothetical protein FX988_02722 [Paraglaciecola mesophila]